MAAVAAVVTPAGPLVIGAGQQRRHRLEQLHLVGLQDEQVVGPGGHDRLGGGLLAVGGIRGGQDAGQVHARHELAQLGRGRPSGEVPAGLALFPTAPSRTRRDRFPITGLSGDYCVVIAVGCRAWMVSWQAWQTTRVLRRRLAMSATHAGCGRPGLLRSASLPTW